MRRKLALTLALGAVLALTVSAVAAATTTTIELGNLRLTFGGSVTPKVLPKKKLAPVALSVSGKIVTTDGSHPPALREAIVDIDKNGAINTKGVPVCKGSQLEARDTNSAKKVCGPALVGSGEAHAEIAFPESKPLLVPSPLLVFNGGTKGNKTTIFLHTFITVPVPAAIVTTITITKTHNGPYGLHTVSKIPKISGGSGSAVDFKFKINRKGYLEAKCPTGHFVTKLDKAIFQNEAQTPGQPAQTVLTGGLVVPCTGKG